MIKSGIYKTAIMSEKTKDQLEAEISNTMTRFEREYLGRGPREIMSFIVEDMLLIRLKGILTPAEVHLMKQKDGASLVKQVKMRLHESSKKVLEGLVEATISAKVLVLHTDVNPETDERIFVFTLDRDMEQ
jgi:uncharacterized protein YbcI